MAVNKLNFKNWYWFLAVFLLVIHVGTAKAGAHEVLSSNEVSALLHIYPNDAPVAGENDQLEFTFWDQKQAFSLSKCDCHVAVFDGNKEIFSSALATKSAEKYNQKALVDFVFPHDGFFKVILTGLPKSGGEEFAKFQMEYTATVSAAIVTPAQKAQSEPGKKVWLLVFFGVIVAGSGLAVWKRVS